MTTLEIVLKKLRLRHHSVSFLSPRYLLLYWIIHLHTQNHVLSQTQYLAIFSSPTPLFSPSLSPPFSALQSRFQTHFSTETDFAKAT